jgi:hypothetical protein
MRNRVEVTTGLRTDTAIQWLLDGDPAIRWQTLRDLVGAGKSAVERERRRVAQDGWGGRLLARQDRAGTWAEWTGRGETCVTGMVLSILSYFEYDDARLAEAVDILRSGRRASLREGGRLSRHSTRTRGPISGPPGGS